MGYGDEVVDVSTPENIAFHYDLAGIGTRFMAALADTSIIVVVQLLILALVASLAGFNRAAAREAGLEAFAWLGALLGLLAFAVLWGYYVYFEVRWNGQSPGKRWVKIRVVRDDGTPVTLTESLIRNLVRLVDLLPAYYGVGVVVMFLDERSRRLGDLAAGTLVVRAGQPLSLQELSQRPTLSASQRAYYLRHPLPVHLLSDEELQMAQDFLRRRPAMARERGDALAASLSRMLLARMDLEERATERSGEQWLRYIVYVNYLQEEEPDAFD
jgi:uncharacterized RDD family membrane protein YckC